MPTKKTTPTNEDTMNVLYRSMLTTVNLTDVKFADSLEGQERINFCKFCHEVFHSPHFQMIVKGFVFAQAMLTSEKATTHETFNNGKMIIAGIKLLEEYFARYAHEYDQLTAPQNNFDPTKPFEPSRKTYSI